MSIKEVPFWETISALTYERVVTGEDFAPFVGSVNWLSYDAAEDKGILAREGEPMCSGVIWKFRLLSVGAADGHVMIALYNDADGKDVEVIRMAADELAIRMEDS